MFFVLIFVVIMVAWTVDQWKKNEKDRNLTERMQAAQREGDWPEFFRLNTDRESLRRQRALEDQRNARQNERAWEALLVLDMAENGIFIPGTEQVFDEMDRPVEDEHEEPEYYADEDYGYDEW